MELEKRCLFSRIDFTCAQTDCRACQVMRAFQEKLREDELCPVCGCHKKNFLEEMGETCGHEEGR